MNELSVLYVDTLFWSDVGFLTDETKLHSIRTSIYENQKVHQLKYNKIDHKTHIISGVNCYMFRH
jgi:homospermidine synthase